MNSKELFYRNTISICWVILIQIVTIMFVVALLYGAIADDFTEFATHPGDIGVNITIITVVIYAALSLLVRFVRHVVFRWFVFACSIFFFLLFLAHQLSHLIVDGRPFDLYNALDFAHHLVALLSAVLCFLWARTRNDSI